ncbi:hypothetical protein Tco_0836905 [Tanacetum coccineum]
MDHDLDNFYNNIPRHQGPRGNFAARDLTDGNDDHRVATMVFRIAHAKLTGYAERYSSLLDARGLTGTVLSREVFWDAAIRDNENWPIVDSVVGGGGPGGPGGGGPRGGGGGDRRGGRGGDLRGGIGDGRRDSRGRRYGPGSGRIPELRPRAILTYSSLLAALFKARKEDEQHQESRQARPNYASTSWRHPWNHE